MSTNSFMISHIMYESCRGWNARKPEYVRTYYSARKLQNFELTATLALIAQLTHKSNENDGIYTTGPEGREKLDNNIWAAADDR